MVLLLGLLFNVLGLIIDRILSQFSQSRSSVPGSKRLNLESLTESKQNEYVC
jgi:hypothetical protein